MKNGKIAVCPLAIREEVNRRLLDGQQGDEVLEWLNAQPEVQQVMKDRFKGKPMLDSNLTQWRQGGYQEWLDEGKKLRAMEAMVLAFAKVAKDTGTSKALDGCVVALVSTIYPVLETLQKGKPSLDELEQAARIVTMLQNAETAKQRVPQRDTLNAIRQGELALRTQSFALKEESVAVEQETMRTEAEKNVLYWKQRAREDARLAAEAWKGEQPEVASSEERVEVASSEERVAGMTGSGQAEVAGSEERVVSMVVSEQQLAQAQTEQATVTVSDGETVRPPEAAESNQSPVISEQESEPTGGDAETSTSKSTGQTDEQNAAGPAVPPYPQAACFLVMGGEAIGRVMSVAETTYERELDERDRRMKIKEEFRRRRLEYLGITGERLKEAL